MAKQQITAQMIDDLFVDAMGGDSDAESELRDLVRKLAKRSNQQMLEQERRDVRGEAYRRAQEFLGGDLDDERGARFKENVKNMDLKSLMEEADELLSFSSAKDYSIPYATQSKEQIENIRESLAAAGVDIEDARVTFWMNELLKTGAWKEYKKAHGRSTNLIQAAQEAFKAGKTVDDLLAAYDDYKEGRDDSPDLVESFEIFAPGGWK